MNQELEALTYPKHIKFGFACFIIFAVLGVFVPLFYNTWDESISKVLILPIENNALFEDESVDSSYFVSVILNLNDIAAFYWIDKK